MDADKLTGSQVLGILTGSDEDLRPRPWWMPVSRPCYNKVRRCPGWAGGGLRYARVRRCDNGYLRVYDDQGTRPLWRWRCWRCAKCGVIVLPWVTRWLDWAWLSYRAGLLREDVPERMTRWARAEFSWWDGETGEWQAWASPREAISRLPEIAVREARYRLALAGIRFRYRRRIMRRKGDGNGHDEPERK